MVDAGGELVVVAGGGVLVRIAEQSADALSAHPAVAHLWPVPQREPVRIRRRAADDDTG